MKVLDGNIKKELCNDRTLQNKKNIIIIKNYWVGICYRPPLS